MVADDRIKKSNSFKDFLFFLIVITLIFISIPMGLRIGFLGGPIQSKLVFYPIVVGLIYTIYVRVKTFDNLLDKNFVKYLIIYGITLIASLIIGLVYYPYFDLIINAPVVQIEKLPMVIDFFDGYGVHIDFKFATGCWMIARVVKSVVFEIVYIFGGAYLIYFWYKNNWKNGFDLLCKGILISMFFVFCYSFVELFYLAGNQYAKDILKIITPYIHVIKINHGWWPPLLWKGQIRSVFPEPSFFSIWASFALPFVWYKCINSCKIKTKLFHTSVLIFFTFLIFMTKARTGVALLCGEICLFMIYTFYVHNKVSMKQFFCILLSTVIAFGLSNHFHNNCMPKNKTISIRNYVEDNIVSIASTNKRSNNARYSTIYANIKIGLDNPILGVGPGLSSGYMPEYFPEMAKDNREVRNWIKYQEKQGILRMGIPSFSAYSLKFAETGFVGVFLYMLPPLLLAFSLCKKIIMFEDKTKYVCLLISLLGILASGFRNTLNVTYCYPVLLGLGYAMCFGKENEKDT